MEKIHPKIVKDAKRSCGHPFMPTFDITLINDQGNLEVTSYCVYCMLEKLGMLNNPCSKCIIPKNMKDPSEIKWIFNK